MAQPDITGYLSAWKAQTFNARPEEDLQLWLCDIRYGLKQRRVPRAEWVPVASHFLGPEVQGVLREVQEGIDKLEPGGWNWDRFTSSLTAIHDKVKKDAVENDPETIGEVLSRLRRDHPVETAAAGLGLIAQGGSMAQTDIAGYLSGWTTQTFNARPEEDLDIWLCDIRYGLKQRRVPRAYWVPVASHFLGPELQGVLSEVREGVEKLEPGGWNWDRFTASLTAIHDKVKTDAAENDPTIGAVLFRLRRDHPVETAAAGIGLIALGGVVSGPVIVAGTLKILGFHAAGIAGGSIAAGIKTAVYGGYVASRTAVAAAGPVRALSAGAMAVGAWVGFEVNPPSENGDTAAAEPVPLDDDASTMTGDGNGVDNNTVAAEPDNSTNSIPLENGGTVAAEPVPLEDASATTGDGNSAAAAEPDNSAHSTSLDVDESAPSVTGNDSASNGPELVSLEDDECTESAATIGAENGPNIGPVAAEAVSLEDPSSTTGNGNALNNNNVAAEPNNSAQSISLDVDERAPCLASVAGNDGGSNTPALISFEDDECAESATNIRAENGPNIGPVVAEPVALEEAYATTSDGNGLDNNTVTAEPDNSGDSISLDVDGRAPCPASVTGNDDGSNSAELIFLEDDESAISAPTIPAENGPVAAGPIPLEDNGHTISAPTITDDDKRPISSRDVRTE
ncbi:hypothetical protein C8R45DRAFT_991352 [Mycena sanguinolenta]|nr:hypothetical protein C8R45DRAFT_991352 [Mycena sanguinolenta]